MSYEAHVIFKLRDTSVHPQQYKNNNSFKRQHVHIISYVQLNEFVIMQSLLKDI